MAAIPAGPDHLHGGRLWNREMIHGLKTQVCSGPLAGLTGLSEWPPPTMPITSSAALWQRRTVASGPHLPFCYRHWPYLKDRIWLCIWATMHSVEAPSSSSAICPYIKHLPVFLGIIVCQRTNPQLYILCFSPGQHHLSVSVRGIFGSSLWHSVGTCSCSTGYFEEESQHHEADPAGHCFLSVALSFLGISAPEISSRQFSIPP